MPEEVVRAVAAGNAEEFKERRPAVLTNDVGNMDLGALVTSQDFQFLQQAQGQPARVFDFATEAIVLDTYRGPGTMTIKGVGLMFHLANQPDLEIQLTLGPDLARKLARRLEHILKRQDEERYGADRGRNADVDSSE